MTQVKLCNSVLVSGGLLALGHEPVGKEERMIEIYLKKDPNVSARVSIEEVRGQGPAFYGNDAAF